MQIHTDIEKAIEISKNAETYEGAGKVYYYYGDLDNAKKCFQEAIKLEPKNSELYIKLVQSEIVNPVVIEQCNEYLKKFPNEYQFYILKMDAMLDMGENIDKSEIEKMLKIGNRMEEIYNEIGCICFYNKDYQKAIENYGKAIEYALKNKPKYYKSSIEAYYINKENVYSEIGDNEKVRETLEKIIEINIGNEEDNLKNNSKDGYFRLANYYLTRNYENKANENLEKSNENYEKSNEIAEYQSYLER